MTARGPRRWSAPGAVLALAGVLLAGAVLASAGGFRLTTVDTASMAPAIPAGSLVLERSQPTEDLRVGQVITYRAPTPQHQVLTHRVAWVGWGADGAASIRTRGDANPGEDPWQAQIAGTEVARVLRVLPGAGAPLAAVRDLSARPPVLALAVLVAVALVWLPRPAPPVRATHATRARRGPRRRTSRAGVGGLALLLAAGAGLGTAPPSQAAFSASATRAHQSATGVLSAPATLRTTAGCLGSRASVTLAWTSPGDVRTGVAVQRSTGGANTWTTLATTAASATGYVDTTVSLVTTYTYRLQHRAGPWTGPLSPTSTVTTLNVCV